MAVILKSKMAAIQTLFCSVSSKLVQIPMQLKHLHPNYKGPVVQWWFKMIDHYG